MHEQNSCLLCGKFETLIHSLVTMQATGTKGKAAKQRKVDALMQSDVRGVH